MAIVPANCFMMSFFQQLLFLLICCHDEFFNKTLHNLFKLVCALTETHPHPLKGDAVCMWELRQVLLGLGLVLFAHELEGVLGDGQQGRASRPPCPGRTPDHRRLQPRWVSFNIHQQLCRLIRFLAFSGEKFSKTEKWGSHPPSYGLLFNVNRLPSYGFSYTACLLLFPVDWKLRYQQK